MANRIQKRVTSMAERLFPMEHTPRPPRTVLVVDDEEGIRNFVERVLQGAGYTTVIAGNGPEALRLAASLETLDMVVTGDGSFQMINGRTNSAQGYYRAVVR